MNDGDEVSITGRDFGRLEGKVDAIAEDVGELKKNMLGTVDRVSAVEKSYTELKTAQTTLKAVQDQAYQSNEGKQTTRQTWIFLVSVGVGVVALVVSIATAMHW